MGTVKDLVGGGGFQCFGNLAWPTILELPSVKEGLVVHFFRSEMAVSYFSFASLKRSSTRRIPYSFVGSFVRCLLVSVAKLGLSLRRNVERVP